MGDKIRSASINIGGSVVGKNQIAIKIDNRKYHGVPSELRELILQNTSQSNNANELLAELKAYMDGDKEPSRFDKVIKFLKGLGVGVLEPLKTVLVEVIGPAALTLLFGA